MLRKVRFLVVLISLSVCLCLMSSTYSRYVADTPGNIDILFSKWQILVNDNDITSDTSSSITFMPIMDENDHVAPNTIAPSSKGHFDIEINPRNVNVSFKYTINLGINTSYIPDLMITKYSVIPSSYSGEGTIVVDNLENNIITDTVYFDKKTENFQFEPFIIRIYFEWYEGDNELMDNEHDTAIGYLAATENLKFTMSADIAFEQVMEPKEVEE